MLLFSILMLPIMYAFGVYMPMILADSFYTIFKAIGGASFAEQLFNTKNGFTWDWTNPIFILLFVALAAGILMFAVFAGVRAITAFSDFGKKHTIGLFRVGYGCAGIILVPTVFVALTTISALIFRILSPSGNIPFVGNGELAEIKQYFNDTFIVNIKNDLTAFGIQYEWNGLSGSLDELLTNLNTLAASASSAGDTAQYTLIEQAISSVSSLKIYADPNWWNSLENSIDQILSNVTIGQRMSYDDFEKFQTAYNSLVYASAAFNSAYNNILSLYTTYYPGASGSDAWKFVDKWITLFNYGENHSAIASDFLSWNGRTDTPLILIFMQNGFGGGDDRGLYSFTRLYNELNPSYEFVFLSDIFKYVTGLNGGNYRDPSMIFLTSFEFWRIPQMMIGAIATYIVSGAMGLFAWFVLKRIFDLIILWPFSIYIAFTDQQDGAIFKKIIKLIFFKIFAIIVVQIVFQAMNIIVDTNFIGGMLQTSFNSNTSNENIWLQGALTISLATMYGASYYTGDMITGIILGEPGTMRGIADQMGSIKNTGQTVSGDTKGTTNESHGVGKQLMGDIHQIRLQGRIGGGNQGAGPAPGVGAA